MHVHIHRSHPAELIPGKKERFKHVDADPSEATVWHFRKLKDYYKSDKTFISTDFKERSKLWEESFKKRLQSGRIGLWIFKKLIHIFFEDAEKPWKNYGNSLGLKIEECRQKQNKERSQRCHNLHYCEVQIPEINEVDWKRSKNTWYFV